MMIGRKDDGLGKYVRMHEVKQHPILLIILLFNTKEKEQISASPITTIKQFEDSTIA